MAMATRMVHNGLLDLGNAPGKSHFKAFAKRKFAWKGALIADLRALNSMLPKPIPFRLPSFG